MNCKDIENRIIFYVENRLTDVESKSIEQHISECTSCKMKYDIIKAAYNTIEDEKNIQVNPFISTRILQKIEESKRPKVFVKKVLQPAIIGLTMIMGIWFGNIIADNYVGNTIQNAQVDNSQNVDESVQFVVNDIIYEDYYFLNSQ